jgi:hypothetical protein
MILLVLFSLSIILNAIGDGLNNNNKKTVGHLFVASSILVLLLIPSIIVWNQSYWYIYIIAYTFLRYSLFSYTYNITRGLPFNYLGITSIDDIILTKFGGQPLFIRIITLIVGTSLILRYL